MSFTASLATDVVSVDAGGSASLTLEVANRGDASEKIEIEVEGIDPEWTAIPVPTFPIEPGDTVSQKVFVKPPRTSESVAGSYPFVIKVRSLETGESKNCQAVLEISAFHHLSGDLNPKRASVNLWRRIDDVSMTLMNLGNSEHTLQLAGNDPDDECLFTFEEDQVTLGPGQQRDVHVQVGSRRSRAFGGARLHGFSVMARSLSNQSVSCTAQGQLEQRPLLSPAGILAFCLVALLATAWWALRPKQPTAVISLQSSAIVRGDPLVVQWRLEDADSVRITLDEQSFLQAESSGEQTFLPEASGVVTAIPYRDGVAGRTTEMPFTVEDPAPVPQPKIEEFKISSTTLDKGQTFAVRYKFNSATVKATLSPPGMDLNIAVPEVELIATRTGTIEYTLVALNAKGDKDEKKIKVTVVEGSQASIVVFTGSPLEFEETPGTVTIEWQLTNAVRAEIHYAGEKVVVDADRGSQQFSVDRNTEFKIVAYDEQGLTVSKTVAVKVKEQPPLPPETLEETQ